MKTTISRSSWATALAVGATLASTPVAAQDVAPASGPAPRTHLVRTGDTLWDLARTYLNDPFLWPEIYRLNPEIVEDPHWIYPGETLQLPDGSAAGGLEPSAAPESDGAPSRAGGTVFSGAMLRRGGSAPIRSAIGLSRERPLVRPGDWYAAPWVGRQGGVAQSGRVTERAERSGIKESVASDRLQFNDPVLLAMPGRRPALVGQRYVSYRLDRTVGTEHQVLVPTAIVTVETPLANGRTVGRVTDAFDQPRVGDHLIPLDSFVTTPYRAPEPVTLGRRARVLWMQNDPVLPSLHGYVVLSSTDKDGLVTGDQFTLLRRVDGETGPSSPDVLAVVQVIRVTAGGTTGMIIEQSNPGLAVGTPARLTAKMP